MASLKKQLQLIGEHTWRLPKQGKMGVDALVYLTPQLLDHLEDEALQQLARAAELPGVFKHVLGMPDIHTGYGLPIGGVMATDANEGVISAGAVGMDINCGVRLLQSNIKAASLSRQDLQRLMSVITKRIPLGMGGSSREFKLSKDQMQQVMVNGVQALDKMGLVWSGDIDAIEEQGCLPGADPEAVTSKAWSRANQLGTLGSGNHFIEIGVIEEIFDEQLATVMDLEQGQLTIMIHSGSRGLGHQTCVDYSRILNVAVSKYGIQLPDKGLAAVPISSREGRAYYGAMAAAVNYAFANRQVMTHQVRLAVSEVLGDQAEVFSLQSVYDVAHNIAKFEEHFGKQLLVHRKGATRALPPGHTLNPKRYKHTGHPALIPGSMGTSSYVVFGKPDVAQTFNSVNHGAGRLLSRQAAKKQISEEDFQKSMQGTLFNASYRKVVDEAPGAYKDVDEVVETLVDVGVTVKAVRLKPLAVLKGS